MDKGGKALLISRSSHDQPTQSWLADATGKRLTWIEENALAEGHPYAPYLASHRSAQFGTIKRSEEHTSELQSLMRISYAVFCLKIKNKAVLITISNTKFER